MEKHSVLVGLVGTNLQFSMAPQIHMTEGDRNGLRYVYRLIDLANNGTSTASLQDLVKAAPDLGFNGLAVTHPFKEAIIPFLADLSPDAQLLGAVNTVVFSGARSTGHNTDWSGYAAAFRAQTVGWKTDRVALLGVGGAGKAVAHALLSCGVGHLSLVVRNPDKVARIVHDLGLRHGADRISIADSLEQAVSTADGLVNGTPIGMAAHPGNPVPPELLRANLWVSDLIYNPGETELLKAARLAGASTINGMGMLIYQAAQQFELFTGISPDIQRMQEHVNQLLLSKKS